jgi:hypothetical protein
VEIATIFSSQERETESSSNNSIFDHGSDYGGCSHARQPSPLGPISGRIASNS